MDPDTNQYPLLQVITNDAGMITGAALRTIRRDARGPVHLYLQAGEGQTVHEFHELPEELRDKDLGPDVWDSYQVVTDGGKSLLRRRTST